MWRWDRVEAIRRSGERRRFWYSVTIRVQLQCVCWGVQARKIDKRVRVCCKKAAHVWPTSTALATDDASAGRGT
jgi:hypothetical protein